MAAGDDLVLENLSGVKLIDLSLDVWPRQIIVKHYVAWLAVVELDVKKFFKLSGNFEFLSIKIPP